MLQEELENGFGGYLVVKELSCSRLVEGEFHRNRVFFGGHICQHSWIKFSSAYLPFVKRLQYRDRCGIVSFHSLRKSKFRRLHIYFMQTPV